MFLFFVFLLFQLGDVDGECVLAKGDKLDAPEFVCLALNRAKMKDEKKRIIPPELKNATCPQVAPFDHGRLFCSDANRAGSICLGNGYL